LLLPSLIDDDAVCKAVLVAGALGVWFLIAAADTWVDEEDGTAAEEVDVEVADRCADELGGTGLLGGVFPVVPSK